MSSDQQESLPALGQPKRNSPFSVPVVPNDGVFRPLYIQKKNIHTLLLTSAFVLCFCLFMLIKPEPSQLTQALQYPTDFLWKYFSSWTSQIQPIQCENTSLLFPKFWLLEQASFGWMDGSELFIYFLEISRWILFLMQPSLVLCFIHCVMLNK